jgi:hypothetical protein
MGVTPMQVASPLRIRRGVPTRLDVDGARLSLGLLDMDDERHSARLGVHGPAGSEVLDLCGGDLVSLGQQRWRVRVVEAGPGGMVELERVEERPEP